MAYVYQEFPKVKYHATKEPVTVANAEEERKLGEGWADTPAAFPFYNRKVTDPVPNSVEEVNAELEHWYVQLSKDPGSKGSGWWNSIETRIEQLKFRKAKLLEAPPAKHESVPPDERNFVDRRLAWFKNNKPMGVLILLGIVIIALASFTSALQSLWDFFWSAYSFLSG
ncbi:MAG: hypothetical protein A3H28_15110 [Acidobacteria bacterium RIFCSPLOWO2_02_FULL_61_28]|nr:MAG: hypothetical protein A3H28_15110 [Acidobacteria bacterium RIFCSPLOWO2_02_FULL_61_28]